MELPEYKIVEEKTRGGRVWYYALAGDQRLDSGGLTCGERSYRYSREDALSSIKRHYNRIMAAWDMEIVSSKEEIINVKDLDEG